MPPAELPPPRRRRRTSGASSQQRRTRKGESSMDTNRVILSGHLGSDANVQEHDGLTVARLRLGTTSPFRDRAGKLHDRTDWHRVTLFDDLARRVQGLREGDLLTVRGTLRTFSFENCSDARVSVEVEAASIEIPPAEVPGHPARRNRFDPSASVAAALQARRDPRPRLTRSQRHPRPAFLDLTD